MIVKAGDEKSFKVKFPKDYQAEELAGQESRFFSGQGASRRRRGSAAAR